MQRPQWIAVAVAVAAFAILYWGLEHRPPELRTSQVSADQTLAATSAQVLIKEALPQLDARTEAEIHGFSKMLEAANSTRRRVEVLEDLSGTWYRAGHAAIAGYYAEQIAELQPSDTTWGIAATTYSLCLRSDTLSAKQKAYCQEHAVVAYENAISLAPANTTHKVNLALHFTDNPPADNPMRGIRMLLDMNAENPDDVAVLVQLGRLALQTNQNEKAIGRLQRAVALQPDNAAAHCLLAEAAHRTGEAELAATSDRACRALYTSGPNL